MRGASLAFSLAAREGKGIVGLGARFCVVGGLGSLAEGYPVWSGTGFGQCQL